MPPVSLPPPANVFDDDDDGWQDMPIIREDEFASGLDEEDQRKYHYQPSAKGTTAANATGNLIDVDDLGNEWRSKLDQNESEYTRLRVNEEEDADEVHLRTRYLFDEDKAMTPLSQMQATKNLLTEAQRIAYVGLCALTSREMLQSLRTVKRTELKPAVTSMELWLMKIMGRLYYHMELETQEQKMIESLAEHGVLAMDLVPALMTTHTVANPEYDPEEARRQAEDAALNPAESQDDEGDDESISDQTLVNQPISPTKDPDREGSKTPTPLSPEQPSCPITDDTKTSSLEPNASTIVTLSQPGQTTSKVLKESSTAAIPGVSTTLSAADENVTLDIRWTVLCDLFLILIADSVYDARSRVLLENVAQKLGLGWLDLVKFESRVTEALEIQEDIETLEQQEIVDGARKAGKKRRYMMLGLATLGGGLVIGLSAGLLAPVIGLGLAGALTTVGVTGTGAFLGGTAGAAVITTGGVLTGSSIAVRGMAKRTRQVRTFEILPLHNNKRVNCILTVPGFITSFNDDVRLPFSVLDPIVGDVFSVLWEPDMIRETGSALQILTGEVLSQIGMTVLQATVMTGLMSALQWPIILTKLGYLIDNPWSNALDRAKGAGRVLADVLIQRHLGVRPITLIGFSLGARVIFYALLEIAKQKQYGIVQDVFLLGATLTASKATWYESRSVVSGRYVNAFARNDWVLNYLFRATSGGVGTVAGLRPVEGVPGLENVDVTDKIAGHMSYRTFMPLILDQLGFPVFSDFFDEPEEPEFDGDRVVVRDDEAQSKKKGWFSNSTPTPTHQQHVSRPPSAATWAKKPSESKADADADDELPPRMEAASTQSASASTSTPSTPDKPKVKSPEVSSGRSTPTQGHESSPSSSHLPLHAGFDLKAIKEVVGNADHDPRDLKIPSLADATAQLSSITIAPPSQRSQSTPPTTQNPPSNSTRASSLEYEHDENPSRHTSTLRDAVSTPFNRSVSEDNYRPSFASNSRQLQSSSLASSSFYSDEDPAFARTPRPSHMPIPVADDPVVWGAPSLAKPLGSSLNLGNSSITSTRPYVPFSSNATAGLSFGSADGSITPVPLSDPWIAPDWKKKTPTDINPWS